MKTADIIGRRFTRSDPRGAFPSPDGAPELAVNRLGLHWRPIVDMADCSLAPLRLRMIAAAAERITEPAGERVLWFARLGVPGLRHQVLVHAGLPAYDCLRPQDLDKELRTEAWSDLVSRLDDFAEIGDRARALTVYQLGQLSFCSYAATLADVVEPSVEDGSQYWFQLARMYTRLRRTDRALEMFERLAAESSDPQLALLSAFQGSAHALYSGTGVETARRFEAIGDRVSASEDWYTDVIYSGFHRARALRHHVEGAVDGVRREMELAWSRHFSIERGTLGDIERQIADGNRWSLLDLEIKFAVGKAEPPAARLRSLARELSGLDPTCVEARLLVGDAYAASGDLPRAARWYALAGELGTSSGAMGWFRAGLCLDRVGDRPAAVTAMGRCLELDTTAVEPREYLESAAI